MGCDGPYLLLVGADGRELLLLQHFHECLLQRLAHHNFKYRFHLTENITNSCL